jgi:hypothetical protein
MPANLASRPGNGSLQYFAPMTWLLSQDDVRFFAEFPGVASKFRRSRYNIYLAYLRDLHVEIAAFNRESFRLIAHGAWDLLPHLCRKRALLAFHEARLLRAAVYYRWLPVDVSPMVAGSFAKIVDEVGLLGAATA